MNVRRLVIVLMVFAAVASIASSAPLPRHMASPFHVGDRVQLYRNDQRAIVIGGWISEREWKYRVKIQVGDGSFVCYSGYSVNELNPYVQRGKKP